MISLSRLRVVLAGLIAAGAVGFAHAQEIKVGGIFDLTGITSDVGKPFAQGVRDYVELTNRSVGIDKRMGHRRHGSA